MNDIPRYSVSVAAAIINNHGQTLAIQRRDNGHWEPPGGIVEHGETLEQALHREVEEETGLHVEVEHLTGIYQNLARNVVAFVFRCRLNSGTLRPTAESQNAAWLSTDQIRQHMDEAYAIRLLDATRTTPTIRVHDGVDIVDTPSKASRA